MLNQFPSSVLDSSKVLIFYNAFLSGTMRILAVKGEATSTYKNSKKILRYIQQNFSCTAFSSAGTALNVFIQGKNLNFLHQLSTFSYSVLLGLGRIICNTFNFFSILVKSSANYRILPTEHANIVFCQLQEDDGGRICSLRNHPNHFPINRCLCTSEWNHSAIFFLNDFLVVISLPSLHPNPHSNFDPNVQLFQRLWKN